MKWKSVLSIHESYRSQLKIILSFVLFLFVLMIITYFTSPIKIAKGINGYIPIHIFLETISIIISIMVFAFCWGINLKDRPGNFLILSSIFFGVALIDFMHTISFKGMPDFITPSSAEKGINFWLSARFLFSAGMFIIALKPWKELQEDINRWKILFYVLLFVVIDTWIVLKNPDWIPHTYIDGFGLTSFKKFSEYSIIIINLITSFLFLRQMNEKREYDVLGLFAATLVTAISEFFFTFYVEVSDFNNLIGHVYKCVAYAFVYRSIFQDSLRIIIERLNQNEQLLAGILDTLPVAVFVKDIGKNFQFKIWNQFAEKIYSLKATEVIGKNDSDFFPKEEAKWFHEKDVEAILSHEVIDIPEEFVHTKNGSVTVHTKKIIVRDTDDRPLFLLGVSEDISEIKKITNNLKNAVKARDEFLIIASHELKTPITTLKLRLQIMQRHFASNEQITGETKILLKQVDRLVRLMNSILDVSRIQSGQFTLDTAQMIVNEILTGVIEQFSEQLYTSKCHVDIDIKETIIRNWDQARLEQIFTNLLSNTIKYAPGCRITIQVQADENFTTIIYHDSGPGISEENQRMVFERFERAGAPLSISGLGLGLFICKKIVEAMNGTIHLESAPGKGTTFIMKLPNDIGESFRAAPATVQEIALHPNSLH